jgi:ABC-type sugar transport system ATPase subunit
VRPEHLEPCVEAEAALFAEVDLVEQLGADILAHGKVDATRITVRLPASQRVREGRLPLRFDPANAHDFDPASGARIDR